MTIKKTKTGKNQVMLTEKNCWSQKKVFINIQVAILHNEMYPHCEVQS